MDPLHVSIALGPLAIYVMVLAIIQLSGRPLAITGFSDIVALGLGVVGFVMAGPMELFYPDSALARYGPLVPSVIAERLGIVVWLVLILLYGLSLVWIALAARPHLVIYNIRRDQLWTVVEQLLPELDPQAQRGGDAISLLSLGLQVSIESHGVMRCVQVTSVGHRQEYRGWRQFRMALRQPLAALRTPVNPAAIPILLLATAMVVLIVVALTSDQDQVQQAVTEMLRL